MVNKKSNNNLKEIKRILVEMQKPRPNMANPSATFAKEQGLPYKIVNNPDGSQGGVVIVDGNEVDAWDYYRENKTYPTPTSRKFLRPKDNKDNKKIFTPRRPPTIRPTMRRFLKPIKPTNTQQSIARPRPEQKTQLSKQRSDNQPRNIRNYIQRGKRK